jgi:hypothetical protein
MTVTFVTVFLIPPPSAPPLGSLECFIKGDLPLHMKLLYEDLVQAYLDARRGKSNKSEVIARNENLEDNMKLLYHDLSTNQYHIGRPIRFIIQDPVVREIIALSFRDRIVQHLVHHYLYPVFDP